MYKACGIVRLCFTAATVTESPANPSRIERSLRGHQRVTSKDAPLRETFEKPAITRKHCRETIPLILRILKSCNEASTHTVRQKRRRNHSSLTDPTALNASWAKAL